MPRGEVKSSSQRGIRPAEVSWLVGMLSLSEHTAEQVQEREGTRPQRKHAVLERKFYWLLYSQQPCSQQNSVWHAWQILPPFPC